MIIIAPDKFKGTLTAAQAAQAIADGLRDAGIREELRLCPMADGGDGTAEILQPLLRGNAEVVESHAFVGPGCFSSTPPMERSSFALGKAIADAARKSRDIYVGIGGTACCDGGAGALQAMGLRAFDRNGYELMQPLSPATLPQVASVDLSTLAGCGHLTALYDVEASLIPGTSGLSALDFAMQKGFSDADTVLLKTALEHWAGIASPGRCSPIDGAGGGIGFALASVAGSRIISGAEFILDCYGIDFSTASLVITGEGCIDSQTDGGKVVSAVARRAAAGNIPILAIGGKVKGTRSFPTLAVSAADSPVPESPSVAAERLRLAVRVHMARHRR